MLCPRDCSFLIIFEGWFFGFFQFLKWRFLDFWKIQFGQRQNWKNPISAVITMAHTWDFFSSKIAFFWEFFKKLCSQMLFLAFFHFFFAAQPPYFAKNLKKLRFFQFFFSKISVFLSFFACRSLELCFFAVFQLNLVKISLKIEFLAKIEFKNLNFCQNQLFLKNFNFLPCNWLRFLIFWVFFQFFGFFFQEKTLIFTVF